MARRARIVVPGFPHHVSQRGNRKANVYLDREDRQFYLSALKEYSSAYGTELYSYCLMTNHIHLIAVPEAKELLSRCMHDLNGHYAGYFNKKYGHNGHLWQARFYACVLDTDHLWTAVRYVEQNPVRAKMVAVAEEYPWSGAAAHCGLKEDPLLSKRFPPNGLVVDWSAWLKTGLPDEDLRVIRDSTWKGIPCGTAAFLESLESLLGISLVPRKRGRPKGSLSSAKIGVRPTFEALV